MNKEDRMEAVADTAVHTENDYVIELKDVTKDYGDFVLDKVSFNIPRGCICGFVGQNGAGKTTTIRLIMDIIAANSGEMKVFGRDMRTEGKILKDDIGVVFDEMGFHDFLTGVQINKIMGKMYTNWSEEVFTGYMKRFGLPMKKKCGKFSRGMRMKLQIAVAISHGAKLLIMDEPTSGLDPIVRNEILEIFQEFVMEEDHTILLSSHITGDIERIADMVVFIDKGRIVLSGEKDVILENHAMIKCSKKDADTIAKEDIVSVRQSAFGVDVLVHDKKACARKYEKLTMEQCSLEEIMIHYVNRANNGSKEA